jgi:hypothetical protein
MKIGVVRQAVSHWISGERHPRPDTTKKIIKKTGGEVTMQDICGRHGNAHDPAMTESKVVRDIALSYFLDEANVMSRNLNDRQLSRHDMANRRCYRGGQPIPVFLALRGHPCFVRGDIG